MSLAYGKGFICVVYDMFAS